MPFAFVALVGSAWAGVPAEVYLQPEPPDIAVAFTEFATSQARTGPAAQVRCRHATDGLELCFRYQDQGSLRYVTALELSTWGVDLTSVEAAAIRTAKRLDPKRFEATTIPETEGGRYWVSRQGDGLDGAVLLVPEVLTAVAGGEVVVAVPASGVLVFWRPGNQEIDRIMAVGVRRMMEASDHPVSASIYRWDATRWKVWAETVPTGGRGGDAGSGTGSGSGTTP